MSMGNISVTRLSVNLVYHLVFDHQKYQSDL